MLVKCWGLWDFPLIDDTMLLTDCSCRVSQSPTRLNWSVLESLQRSDASQVLQTSAHVFPASGYMFLVHVCVHVLLKQDVHAQSCFPFSYWKRHSVTTVILCGFCEPNLWIAETFSKVTQWFQCTPFATAEFPQVLHVINHSTLEFNQYKMIKSHVVNPVVKNQWLSSLIGFHLLRCHWWFTSSYVIT